MTFPGCRAADAAQKEPAMSAVRIQPLEAAEVTFARARAHAAKAESMLASTEMIRKPHSDLEQMLDEQGREWARLMLEEHLALRAQLEKKVEVTDAEGVERTTRRDSERHLETLVGRVAVPRQAYQAPGVADLHPMDAALNLPRELFSHGIRRMVAKEAAREHRSMRSSRLCATTPARRSRSGRSRSWRSGPRRI